MEMNQEKIIERPDSKKYALKWEGLSDFSIDQDKYIDQIESENKELIEALKAISKVTEDAELPLLKVIHQISFKTLKAVK